MILENQQAFNHLMDQRLKHVPNEYVTVADIEKKVKAECEDYDIRKQNYKDFIDFYLHQHNVNPHVRSKIGAIDEANENENETEVILDRQWTVPVVKKHKSCFMRLLECCCCCGCCCEF